MRGIPNEDAIRSDYDRQFTHNDSHSPYYDPDLEPDPDAAYEAYLDRQDWMVSLPADLPSPPDPRQMALPLGGE